MKISVFERVVNTARRRWRVKLLLRGLLVVLPVSLIVVLASGFAADRLLYGPTAVFWLRALGVGLIVVTGFRFVVSPQLRRVSNLEVAAYVEEHEPSLQEALLTAVASEQADWAASLSPAMRRELTADAIRKAEAVEFAERVDRPLLKRLTHAVAGVLGAGFLAVLLSPAFVRQGALFLLTPWRAGAADNPYRLLVAPKNMELARGADVRIAARLVGARVDAMELHVLPEGEERWRVETLVPTDASDDFGTAEVATDGEFLVLDVRSSFSYFVRGGTLRSPTHTIVVVDLPWADRLDLTITPPRYTSLEPEVIEDGGDIVALRGSKVGVQVIPNIAVSGGRLILANGETVELEPLGEAWQGSFTVADRDFYRVELNDLRGRSFEASNEFVISPTEDAAPTLRIISPGRDVRANKLEEILIEVEASDDYGVRRVDLIWSTALGEEQKRELAHFGEGRGEKRISASHTFFLEDFELQDGDFVSYYAQTSDGRATTVSDIYFVEIRPFGQEYRKAPEGGSPAGGGGVDSQLSAVQRQVVAAIFRLTRDRKEFEKKEFAEGVRAVALSEEGLTQQVRTLIERMGNRSTMGADSEFSPILENLSNSLPEMEMVKLYLDQEKPELALAPARRALSLLQRAESAFREVRVSLNRDGGGGGDQGGLSEDLADLFELELDKLSNQYEVVQRGQQEQEVQEVDEIAQKLRELARRQQQENERRRQLTAGAGGGGSSKSQEDLIAQTEELARRLERLSRERGAPELRETSDRLREAAAQMRRGQAAGRQSSGRSETAGSSGLSAVDALEQARRLLEKRQTNRSQEELGAAQRRTERLGELQQRIAEGVQQLAESNGEGDAEQRGRVQERKDQLAAETEALESSLDSLARQIRADEPEVARGLQEAANSIRKNQLKEKIRYSKGVVDSGNKDLAERFEQEISRNVDELRARVQDAGEAMGNDPGDQREESLERATRLADSLDSLERRLRERQADGEQAQERHGTESGARPGDEPGSQRGAGGEGTKPGAAQADPSQAGTSGNGAPSPGSDRPGDGKSPGEASASGGQSPGQSQGQPGSSDQATNQAGAEGSSGTDTRATGQSRRLNERRGDARGGDNQGGTPGMGPSSGGNVQPGVFGQEDLRQLRGEIGQRMRDGEQLRSDLANQGIDTAELDKVLSTLRKLEPRELRNDPLALDALKAQVVEKLRAFEMALWQQLDPQRGERIRLSRQGDVPSGYENRVAEYFRSLAKTP